MKIKLNFLLNSSDGRQQIPLYGLQQRMLITAGSLIIEHIFHSDEMLKMRIGEILVFVIVGDVFEGDFVDEGDLVGDPPAEADGPVNVSGTQQVAGSFLLYPGPAGPDSYKRVGPAVTARLQQVTKAVIQGSIHGHIVQIINLLVAILANVVVGYRGFGKDVAEEIPSEGEADGGEGLVVMVGAVEELRKKLLTEGLGIVFQGVHPLPIGVEVDDVPAESEGPGTFLSLGHGELVTEK